MILTVLGDAVPHRRGGLIVARGCWLVTGVGEDFGMTAQGEAPSTSTDEYWLFARAPDWAPANPDTSGKWQVYVSRELVDGAWRKVSAMVEAGQLGPAAKVATAKGNPNNPNGPDVHVIIVYAADWRDLDDLRRILRALRDADLAHGWIHFKRDRETRSGAYTNRGSRSVSVWNAAPDGDEISTKWLTGKRVVVTAEDAAEVVALIEAQDAER